MCETVTHAKEEKGTRGGGGGGGRTAEFRARQPDSPLSAAPLDKRRATSLRPPKCPSFKNHGQTHLTTSFGLVQSGLCQTRFATLSLGSNDTAPSCLSACPPDRGWARFSRPPTQSGGGATPNEGPASPARCEPCLQTRPAGAAAPPRLPRDPGCTAGLPGARLPSSRRLATYLRKLPSCTCRFSLSVIH